MLQSFHCAEGECSKVQLEFKKVIVYRDRLETKMAFLIFAKGENQTKF
jgi:hypothetical protein